MKLILLFVFLLSSCAAPENKSYNEVLKGELIIERMSDQSKPNWLIDLEKNSFKEFSFNILSLGYSEIATSKKLNIGIRMAQLDAKANIARSISTKLSYSLKVGSNSAYESISREVSRATLTNVTNYRTYWEKVQLSDGSRKYRIYVAVKTPIDNFKKLLKQTARDHNIQDFDWHNFISSPAGGGYE